MATIDQVISGIKDTFVSSFKLPSFNDVLKTISISDTTTRGIGDFVFTQLRDEEVEFGSNITDYLIESNSYVQDNITLKPIRLRITGLVAETSYGNDFLLSVLNAISNQLLPIEIYVPSLSNATSKIRRAIESIYGETRNIINQIDNIAGIVNSITDTLNPSNIITKIDDRGVETQVSAQTIQQKAFMFFYAKWKSREMVKVVTPFAIFPDMAFESVKIVQSAESKSYSEIEVVLKEVRFAYTKESNVKMELVAGRLNGQIDDSTTNSSVTGNDIVVDGYPAVNIPFDTSDLNLREVVG